MRWYIRLKKLSPFAAIAVAGALNAIGNIHGKALGIVAVRRMHVEQLDRKVGIHGGRANPELQGKRPGYLDVLFKRRSLEN